MTLRKILVAAAMFGSLTLLADDACQAVFTLSPRMTCANCEKKIKSNLRFEKGIKSIDTSIPDQKVTVTYDPSKTSGSKLVEAFRKIGYKAIEAPADTTVRVK